MSLTRADNALSSPLIMVEKHTNIHRPEPCI